MVENSTHLSGFGLFLLPSAGTPQRRAGLPPTGTMTQTVVLKNKLAREECFRGRVMLQIKPLEILEFPKVGVTDYLRLADLYPVIFDPDGKLVKG